MGDRRVVITGAGAVTPLANSLAATWDGLIAGRGGVRRVTTFDASPYDVQIGGECLDFNPTDYIEHRATKRMDRFAQLGFAAGKMAMENAGLSVGDYDPMRAGVIMGSGIGGLLELEQQHMRLLEKGPSRVSAFTIPKLMSNAASGHLSIAFNFQGVNTSVATACASAGSAMGDAFNAIRHNHTELMITGGAEAALTPLGLAAFAAMKALSTRNDAPEKASRPFDRDRDGFILSEGAGALIFEEFEHARRRGARIYAEVIGFGGTADAGDMVQPDPEGKGAARAMAAALQDARINPDQVDYINTHGTSTPLGDIAEVVAIKSVFGPAIRKLVVSSTKSAIGHTLGASGGIEAAVCIKVIENNVIPPTLNHDNVDPQCEGLDFVPHAARDRRAEIVMKNSFGFGGHNACLIFRKV